MTPTRKKHKTEATIQKERVIDQLQGANNQITKKMQELMDLTRQVMAKLKQQNHDAKEANPGKTLAGTLNMPAVANRDEDLDLISLSTAQDPRLKQIDMVLFKH